MLWLRGIVFSVLIPGAVAFLVPQSMRHGPAAAGWYALAWILVGAGVAIYTWCLLDFLIAGGTPAIFFTRPARSLLGEEPQHVVATGLYRYSRNPMYLSVLLTIAGQAIVYRSRGMALYLLFCAAFFHLVVVLLEEPHLTRLRGSSYVDYRRQVPRWIGLPRL